MGKSSQLPWRRRHWMVKEGFRPGGVGGTRGKEECQCLPSPLPLWPMGPPRTHVHSHLQALGAADGGVVLGGHPHISGVCEVAKGWGVGESLPAHLGRRACLGGRAGVSSGLGMRDGVPSLSHVAHGLILRVMARVLAGDFLLFILLLLPFGCLGLRTSFFRNGENENPRASPGESEAS